MASPLPLITVLGATGLLGGSVARALLAERPWRHAVRALTRDPQAPAARALSAAGALVQHADLDDPATLRRAFEGSAAVFAMTSTWEHGSPERELLQARNIACAARDAAVGHLVWSTCEDTRRWVSLDDESLPTLQGRYKVPHFDAKGAANALFRESGVPTTLLYAALPWEVLLRIALRRDGAGYLLSLPTGAVALPGIAAEDIGACVAALFARGPAAAGACVGIAGEHLSAAATAALLAQALGAPVRHENHLLEGAARASLPGAAEWAAMFQFQHDFAGEFQARRPVAATRVLHPGLQGFAAWAARHARAWARGATGSP
jgi:uncharacterized protein YbjT (DUF2867 family)